MESQQAAINRRGRVKPEFRRHYAENANEHRVAADLYATLAQILFLCCIAIGATVLLRGEGVGATLMVVAACGMVFIEVCRRRISRAKSKEEYQTWG
ncbi:hypothetical protein [Actinoplanes palleronii]|uniref:Uncharacterized protein n=1 Tax=Actinoplanes palleronii TaxID=113570 RepID=A0ABQ4BM13_9ACTN|nr:hypothetical protein [Actinoplanes palleronii]GIE71723.1 hypothetical protein Apa02nite_078310 [Actinoplanes palleronii]